MIREVGERYYDLGNLIYRERVERAERVSRLLGASHGPQSSQARRSPRPTGLQAALGRLLCALPGRPIPRASS